MEFMCNQYFFQMSRREIFLSYPFLIQAERKPTWDQGGGSGVLGAHSTCPEFDPQNPCGNAQGVAVYALSSSAGKIETGGALELTSQQVQPNWCIQGQFSKDIYDVPEKDT